MNKSNAPITSRRRPRTVSASKVSVAVLRLPSLMLLCLVFSRSEFASSFGLRDAVGFRSSSSQQIPTTLSTQSMLTNTRKTTTSLNAWFLGNPASQQSSQEEQIAVDIERPTSNSRKIAGELSIPGVTVEDVWSILTDYNRLAIHVPNLRESRIVKENNYGQQKHSPGDGAYKCQLYQVGAQKIIGFDFSASVTMDMTEQILSPETRKIYFKCAESQFFTAFDGSWTVQEKTNLATGELEVVCSYDVLVKPKGPVPVAALEWQIRSEVPTNLRAVKAATLSRIAEAASAASSKSSSGMELATIGSGMAVRTASVARQKAKQLAAAMSDWEKGETMAKYL